MPMDESGQGAVPESGQDAVTGGSGAHASPAGETGGDLSTPPHGRRDRRVYALASLVVLLLAASVTLGVLYWNERGARNRAVRPPEPGLTVGRVVYFAGEVPPTRRPAGSSCATVLPAPRGTSAPDPSAAPGKPDGSVPAFRIVLRNGCLTFVPVPAGK